MIWFLLALLFLGWEILAIIGKLWGTDGVLTGATLVLLALTALLFGGLASLAFSVGFVIAGNLLVVCMVSLLGYLFWNAWTGLR